MPWSGYLETEARQDYENKSRYLFEGPSKIHIGSQKPPRGSTQDGRWVAGFSHFYKFGPFAYQG